MLVGFRPERMNLDVAQMLCPNISGNMIQEYDNLTASATIKERRSVHLASVRIWIYQVSEYK